VTAFHDFYHRYFGKLNRCVFNHSSGHDRFFIQKKMGPKLPVQKVYEAMLCPVQKFSTRYKSTFSLLHAARQAGISKSRKVQFLWTMSMSDLGPENAIFTDKTHLLNEQEGREKVGGSEA
jgi:hypothetical protein